MLLLLLSHFSHVRLLETPWTAAFQAPPSMGFSRQYWSEVPLLSPSDSIGRFYINEYDMVHALCLCVSDMVCHESNISRFKKQQQQICIIIQKFIQVERKLSHLSRNLCTYTYTHIQNRCSYEKRGSVVTCIL